MSSTPPETVVCRVGRQPSSPKTPGGLDEEPDSQPNRRGNDQVTAQVAPRGRLTFRGQGVAAGKLDAAAQQHDSESGQVARVGEGKEGLILAGEGKDAQHDG
jgi:hypothetical protein